MSEPLSTDDIEDVVSSVRRLISPEARPRPVSRDLGQDRLLLTPALRVVSEPEVSVDEIAAPEASLPQEAPVPEAASSLILDASAGEVEVLAEVGASELVAEATPEAAPEAPMADLMTSEDPEAPLHVVDGEWEDAFWSEPEPALAELALGAEEAELVLADDVLPAAGDLDPATWGQDQDSVADDEPVPFVAIHRSAAKAAAAGVSLDEGQPGGAAVDAPESCHSDAEPADCALADTEPSEADASVSGPPASDLETVESADAGSARDLPEPEVELPKPEVDLAEPEVDLAANYGLVGPVEDEEQSPTSGLAASGMAEVLTDQDGNPVTVLDEDALSQIVRMLIREELQGVLGERITHNVRKLVRAEINRALTAKSLD
ncbi:hypothetical protein [Tabrizicola sp.]|uniref:hypothetical protein n=1 Tax=Tabrizicola sp. TaxID=2005166 RepID=UPI00261C1540|nr:hypothetical protein [Tabrizicola sp.]MDM7930605.1 hypothetical protein [Tabrizicola sp.]